ncbi:kinase-like domain-containing protein [Blakeslea trispora]|nr:kinase-like domain-containing protein [Blakeslea trispora]
MTLFAKSSFIPFDSIQPNKLNLLNHTDANKSLILKMTVDLCLTFHHRNCSFQYKKESNPRRALTKPSVPCKNEGLDNENADFILYVHGSIGPPEHEKKYTIVDLLGAGTFGQVARCRSRETDEYVALKIIKNKPAYTKQSIIEVDILTNLNEHQDDNIIQLKESFMFKHHLCLVFELLSINLYDLLRQNRFKGLSTNLVRVFSDQLLNTLITIQSNHIIHCDLKPENILLESLERPKIKVIDFGSACYVSQQTYSYIQSRFYRSPEVLLGLAYTEAIDMWSFGCIVAELFLGLPLFPGSSEYNQLSRIMETVGPIPNHMIASSKYGHRYFNRTISTRGIKYSFKEMTQYAHERHKPEKPSKRYFLSTHLDQLVLKYPMPRKDMSSTEIGREMSMRRSLLDFLQKVLQIDPYRRLTPQEAVAHPFITRACLSDTSIRFRRESRVNCCDKLYHPRTMSTSSSSSSSNNSSEGGNPYLQQDLTWTRAKNGKPSTNQKFESILSPFISPPLDS